MSVSLPPLDTRRPLHATAVALGPKGVLLVGASGRGKSSLALELIALGARLIADDLVAVAPGPTPGARPVLRGVGRMSGVIEARGLGLLRVDPLPEAPLALIVDMDRDETARLPDPVTRDVMGHAVEVVARVASPHFPAFLFTCLKGERVAVSPDRDDTPGAPP